MNELGFSSETRLCNQLSFQWPSSSSLLASSPSTNQGISLLWAFLPSSVKWKNWLWWLISKAFPVSVLSRLSVSHGKERYLLGRSVSSSWQGEKGSLRYGKWGVVWGCLQCWSVVREGLTDRFRHLKEVNEWDRWISKREQSRLNEKLMQTHWDRRTFGKLE